MLIYFLFVDDLNDFTVSFNDKVRNIRGKLVPGMEGSRNVPRSVDPWRRTKHRRNFCTFVVQNISRLLKKDAPP